MPNVFPDSVRAQLQNILNSRYFKTSQKLSDFLQYTVEQTLAGNADNLKEYSIAVEVFGRGASFDPQADAIVRVQAVNLRSRLKQYYEREGAGDPIRIEYAKGSYAPRMRTRREALDSAVSKPEAASIAVLPFVNMSSDPEFEYFSDGLTEELISVLSNVKGLRVVARTSVFQFKGRSEDVRGIGAQLNADMVLEGSVRKAGSRLRITAQLIDVANGYHTWSRTYRVEIEDLFAVQEEISRAIAGTLTERERRAVKRPTESLEAYHLYLKGRFYLNKWTETGFRKSVEFFEEAIAEDPEMAVAWAGLAEALFLLGCYGKLAPDEVMPKARAAAEEASQLNPTLAEPHVALGAVRAIYDWDWSGSEKEFQRAIELDADLAAAHQWYGVLCLIPQGRLVQAADAIRIARNLDPLSPAVNTSLGLVHFVQDQSDEALSCFQKALEIDPDFYLAHWWTGVIHLKRSMVLKAFAAFRRAGGLSQRSIYDAARFTYGDALVGKRGKARRMLEELTRISLEQYFSPVMLAVIHTTLGQTDQAFLCLEKAYEARDPWLSWIGVDRRFNRIRPDPRFADLIGRLGLNR